MELPFHFFHWKRCDWGHASKFIIHSQAVIHFLCSDTLGWVTLSLDEPFYQKVLKILLSLKLEKCCGMQAVMRTIDASWFPYIKGAPGPSSSASQLSTYTNFPSDDAVAWQLLGKWKLALAIWINIDLQDLCAAATHLSQFTHLIWCQGWLNFRIRVEKLGHVSHLSSLPGLTDPVSKYSPFDSMNIWKQPH